MLALAALLAVLVARRTSEHAPVAWSFSASAAMSLLLAAVDWRFGAGAVPRAELALLLATPAFEAWAAGRVFLFAAPWWAYALGWALLAGGAAAGLLWTEAWAVALAASCLAQAAGWGAWRGRGWPVGIAQRTAALVAACDAAALLLGLVVGWSRLGRWGTVAAAGAVVVQAVWLARVRRAG